MSYELTRLESMAFSTDIVGSNFEPTEMHLRCVGSKKKCNQVISDVGSQKCLKFKKK